MRRFIVGFFAFIGFATVLLVAGIMLLVGGLKPSVTPLPGNILLTVDLTRDLPEGASEEAVLLLLVGSKPTMRDFLDAIEAAGNDQRVKVLLARVSATMSWPSPRSRKYATRLAGFAARASSHWLLPIVSASSGPERGPIISPPPSTRSGCSRWGMSASPVSMPIPRS